MEKVSVVTGATGGMGFWTAKLAGEKTTVLLSDVNQEKVNQAVEKLREEGIKAEGMVCDVTCREQVRALAQKAASMGQITAVYNVAGLASTNCSSGEKIMRVNAFGIVYSNEEFSKVMEGGCFVNLASTTAYLLPADRQPAQIFDLVFEDETKFEESMLGMAQTANMAYAISKAFVKYYTAKSAFARASEKGIRVVSVSPGAVDTQMTQNEASAGGVARSVSYTGFNRIGKPEELAFSIVFMGDERNSYVTGVDLLVDGGGIAEGFDGSSMRGEKKGDLDALIKER